ncbi:MAG: hypothetical protein HZB42_15755 [Sphingobacteriales bacterium]|nr:hypothetical protein [Sphingobacteriales bacterium]
MALIYQNLKKLPIIFLFGLLVFVSCSKKTIPTITERSSDPPPPVSPVINVKPDLDAGKTIFANQCSRCHGLPEPNKYNTQRWESILKIMIPRARLDRVQEVHVKAYILANAAK